MLVLFASKVLKLISKYENVFEILKNIKNSKLVGASIIYNIYTY